MTKLFVVVLTMGAVGPPSEKHMRRKCRRSFVLPFDQQVVHLRGCPLLDAKMQSPFHEVIYGGTCVRGLLLFGWALRGSACIADCGTCVPKVGTIIWPILGNPPPIFFMSKNMAFKTEMKQNDDPFKAIVRDMPKYVGRRKPFGRHPPFRDPIAIR